MATTNPVSQVLVTKNDAAPLAKDNPVSALAVGQIGVFDYHTGLSVDATSPAGKTREIFIAVGVDPDGVGSLQDIVKSAGQVIQVRNAKSYTVKGYMADVDKVVDIFGFKAKCDTEYAVKFELRNAEIYALHGYNQFAKTFAFKTGCCEDSCVECGEGDCIELAVGIAEAINDDPDEILTATYFKWLIEATVTAGASADGTLVVTIGSSVYNVPVANGDTAAEVAAKIAAVVNEGTAYVAVVTGAAIDFFLTAAGESTDTFALTSADGTSVTVGSIVAATKTAVTDTDAFKAANPGACLGIRVTGSAAATTKYFTGDIPLKYKKSRETDILTSLIEGFTCNGTVETITELQYSEGKAVDIKYLEYLAGGLNGKPGPYRVSSLTNTQRDGFVYYAVAGATYDQIILTYDQQSVGGWLEYLNNLETVIAIPCASTTTLTGLVAILDAIFTQFPPAADYAATLDCTNQSVAAEDDAEDDGIGSLS